MQIQIQLELDLQAKAIYRNGQIVASTSAILPITEGSERKVTSTVEGCSDKTLALFEKAFEALLKEKQDKAIQLARVQAGEALAVASRMGEL